MTRSPAAPRDVRALFRRLPKAELHLHLFGAIPPDFLAEQFRKHPPAERLAEAPARHRDLFASCPNIRALLDAPEAARDTQALFRFHTFETFLATYLFTTYFVRDSEDLARLVDAVGRNLAAQNVVYAEITVSVVEQLNQGIPLAEILACLDAGARRSDVRVRWIVDLVRDVGPARAEEVLAAVLAARPASVVGITIGGSEHRFPAALFAKSFRAARAAGLNLTAHAGEAAGPESVREALDVLAVARVGHGVRAAEDPTLVARLAAERIPLEICPTSNLRTGVVPSLAAHPARALFTSGVPVTLSTDDPTFFQTDLAGEYAALADAGFPEEDLIEIARNGFRYAFLEESEKEALLTRFETAVAEEKTRGAR